MKTSHHVPEGTLEDSKGRFVPRDAIKPVDLLRHELVIDMIGKVEQMSAQLAIFREQMYSEVESFLQLVASEYDTHLGGPKGNISLTSYDGRLKVQIAVAERIVFDERIQVAKTLVDECIHEWTEESRSEVRVLVDHAFQVDKEGKISLGRVLGLTRIDIKDPKWQRAMDAIRDSMKVVDSKSYIRFYKRPSVEDKFQMITLDVSS